MQNKPNLCHFYTVNPDSDKKQTQTNPIQTQNKAIFTPKNRPQPKTNPIQTQFHAGYAEKIRLQNYEILQGKKNAKKYKYDVIKRKQTRKI